MKWTAADIEKLCACVAEGLSARQIGRRLGRSREAIFSKVHKLGLRIARQPMQGRKAPENGPRSVPSAGPWKPPIVSTDVLASQAGPIPDAEPALVIKAVSHKDGLYNKRPLLDLGRDQCKFPLWSDGDDIRLCCGARRDAADIYCDAHKAVAYEPRGKPIDGQGATAPKRLSARGWR